MYFSVYCSWHFIYYINSKKNISFVLVFQKKIKNKKIKSKIEHFLTQGLECAEKSVKLLVTYYLSII